MKNLLQRRLDYAAELDIANFGDSDSKLDAKLRGHALALPINTK